MLTLGVRYLTGSVVAAEPGNRDRVEWPPHPGRVFMALAAAHFETSEDPSERAALEWLEAQPAPRICAPHCVERPVVTHFVPVNDKAGPSKAPLQSATGLTRERQPRTFARAWLDLDTCYLIWPEAEASPHFNALAQLCGKVTRIGHSSSLVQVWASQEAPPAAPNWLPDETRAVRRLRVPGTGSLSYLEGRFNREAVDEFSRLTQQAQNTSDARAAKAAKKMLKEKYQNHPPVRLRPEISLSHGYAPPAECVLGSPPGTLFDHRLLVFPLHRDDGPYRHLDLTATLQLTERFREAALKHLGPSASEALTGHHGAGRAETPHLAFLSLPFVGREHAHGGILGLALALPRDLTVEDRRALIHALDGVRDEGLKLGALGRWNLVSNHTGSLPATLNNRSWTAYPSGARQWATVTPYVCDRHAKAKDKASHLREIAELIQVSWQRVRAPAASQISVQVIITPVSAHLGVPASHQFPRLKRKDGSECRHTHAILVFDQPICGPLLLGAGRYRGYGLCRPLESEL